MLSVIKPTNHKAASFVNGVRRYQQTSLIVDLIKRSIIEERQITINDIVECYLEKKFPKGKGVAIGWAPIDGRWVKHYVNKEKFMLYPKDNHIESNAKTWFMSNLGAAIIKGKLLVIPIIEI